MLIYNSNSSILIAKATTKRFKETIAIYGFQLELETDQSENGRHQ